MRKKGNMILATILILSIIITLIIAVFVLKNDVIDPINAEIQADSDYGAVSKQISAETSTNYASQWDFIIVFLFVVLWVSSMLLAKDLDTNAVYFGVSIILMIIVLIVAMSLEVTYEDYIDDPDYVGIELKFPKTHWLATHIVPLIIIVGFSIGIFLYGNG